MYMSELPQWFDDTFILTLAGMLGGMIAGCFTCILRSRCTVVDTRQVGERRWIDGLAGTGMKTC